MPEDNKPKDDDVALKAAAVPEADPPELQYRPQGPDKPRTRLGLVGCGGIAGFHLQAARHWGVEVVALADHDPEAARKRRDEFFPDAEIYDDARQIFDRGDIDAVDIATHPEGRPPLIEAALKAGKHVLSQKPFVLELDVGARLAALAEEQGKVLAVNQNGRWAPYTSWAILAAKRGLLGRIQTVDWTMQWDHTWTRGTEFENIRHLVLYDFAIHWIDITAQIFHGRTARSVFARAVEAAGQEIRPPALANLSVEFDQGLATLAFSAHARHGPQERFAVVGDSGTLRGAGDLCGITELDYFSADGHARVPLRGSWFPDGFVGALGEFLLAIEERRQPSHAARDNLRSLELCFAAIASADSGNAVAPGAVTRISK